MKIEIDGNSFGKTTLINGYVITPCMGRQFKINGDTLYYKDMELAEAARTELIDKLEAADPKPNLMANPAFIVEKLQAENLKLKEFVERAKKLFKESKEATEYCTECCDVKEANEQWLSDVEAWEKGSDK